MTCRVPYPFHRIILLYLFSVSLYMNVCIVFTYIAIGMINDAHDNVIQMIFFNEPKIEYYNNSYGTHNNILYVYTEYRYY